MLKRLKIIKDKTRITTVFVFVFLLLIPLARNVVYEQNDEWIYYENVRRFAKGEFGLLPNTAPSFYGAGIPALAFSNLFSEISIPILTLMASVGAALFLAFTLKEHYKQNTKLAVLLGLLLLFNPLVSYATWGFMSDNYGLFYLAAAVYFTLNAEKRGKLSDLLLSILMMFFALNTRQIYILLPAAFSFSYLVNKNRKLFLMYLVTFVSFAGYYFFLFPKTPIMFDNNLSFSNLTYFRYSFSLAFIILIYLVSLLFPVTLVWIKRTLKNSQLTTKMISAAATIGALVYFKPELIWREKYYYLINTVQRRGFLVDNLHGTKPDFFGFPYIYSLLDLFGKLFGIYLVIALITKVKEISFEYVFFIVYVALLLISPYLHDRYLIPLMYIGILIAVKSLEKISANEMKIIIVGFVLTVIYSFNFSMDYIQTNKYVWEMSSDIVAETKTPPGEIVATIAWNLKHPSKEKGHIYKFTYDPPQSQNYSELYTLVEKQDIKFPLSLWEKNTVYLYKINKPTN